MCQDAFGQGATGPFFTGLACVPNTPAAMNVIVQPGAVYAQAALDATAYSSLAADSTVTMKQGILKTAQTFATPAPTTSGQSIVYLISAAFLEADTNAVVLPYYNASNPAQAYSGPNGTGSSQNTTRQDTVQLTLTAGVPATTGSQLTPSTPSGQTALYTITVPYGATSVAAANIASVSSRFSGFVRKDGSTPFTGLQQGVTPTTGDRSLNLATTAMFSNEFASSLNGSNGYQKLPSGYIRQFGFGLLPASGSNVGAVVVTFPITFPNGVKSITASAIGAANSSSGYTPIMRCSAATNSQFQATGDLNGSATVFNQTALFYWQADGN